MPKAKEQSPKPAQPAAAPPAPDLFGFDSAPSAPAAPANNNDASWDAFGGSAQNNTAFQADFGRTPPPAPAPPTQPAPAPGAFQADFGNFSQQQPAQPTMVSLPPGGQPTQPPTQPAAFQANFDQAPVPNQMPIQQQPSQMPQQTTQMQQPQMQHQQGGFANFSSAPQMPQQTQMQQPGQMPQQSTQMQQPNKVQQQGGFANFSSAPQMAQQNTQMHQPTQMQQGGFANFPSTQQPRQQQIVQDNQQQQLGGFANFSSNQQPQQQQPQQQSAFPQQQVANMQLQGGGMMNQQQNAPVSQPGGGMNNAQPPQQQPCVVQPVQQNVQPQGGMIQQESSLSSGNVSQPGGSMNVAQPPQEQPSEQPPQSSQNMQQGGGMMNQQESAVSSGNEQPMAVKNDQQSDNAGAMANGVHNPPAPPGHVRNETEISGVTVNSNAFRSVDDNKKSAFDDAFGGLSLEPSPAAYVGGSSVGSEVSAPSASRPGAKKNLNFTTYQEGQTVLYTNGEGTALATVKKVHYDDELHPYYTIELNGREKQTADTHLSEATGHGTEVSNGGSTSTLMQETVYMLQQLNSQQLMQVQQLVAGMVSGNNTNQAVAVPSLGQNLQPGGMNVAQHGGGMMNQQGSVLSSGNANQMNMANHQQTSFGSESVPAVPMGGAPPPSQPAQRQFSMQQQQPNPGMVQAQQPMGTMGMNAPAIVQTQPSAMQPPAPPSAMPLTQAQPYSMQQQQPNQEIQTQPTMGTGMNGVPTPAPPSGMPPPAPPQPAPVPAQMSMNGFHQQAAGMGETNNTPAAPPAVAPASALPPVEKEGNPFDFY